MVCCNKLYLFDLGPKIKEKCGNVEMSFSSKILDNKKIEDQTSTFHTVSTLISIKEKVLPLLFSHIARWRKTSAINIYLSLNILRTRRFVRSDWFVFPFIQYFYNKQVKCNSLKVIHVGETKQSYLITIQINYEAFYWVACRENVPSVVFYFK
jgi:hypothetical protein